jgi:hypothetical protein
MAIGKFKQWMKESTIDEKRELAKKAETSLALLYQLSQEHRRASSELAGRIEKAAAKINKGLPVLTRGDLSEACAVCKHFKDCQ